MKFRVHPTGAEFDTPKGAQDYVTSLRRAHFLATTDEDTLRIEVVLPVREDLRNFPSRFADLGPIDVA